MKANHFFYYNSIYVFCYQDKKNYICKLNTLKMTNAEAVSKVINSFKYLNKDERIPKRYVLRLLRDSAKTLIAQKLLDRTIIEETNIYTEIKCLQFEKVDVFSCPILEFRTCRTLMKSKCPLPELVFSRLGASIKEATSVDGLTEIYLTSPVEYRRSRKRKYSNPEDVYMYVDVDNFAYIVDKPIYAANVTVITLETDIVTDCSCEKNEDCKSGWDAKFIVPDKLQDVVFKEVLQVLASTYANRRADENPNNVIGV